MRSPILSLLLLATILTAPGRSLALEVVWDVVNLDTGASGSTVVAENGERIEVRIFLDAQTEALGFYSFSLVWDEALDDELDLVSFASTPPPPLLELVPPSVQESTATLPGRLSSFNGASAISSFTGFAQVASVELRVERVSPDGIDFELREIPVAGDGFVDAAQQVLVALLPGGATIDGQAECDDALDNDGDGLTDFSGGDPGCTGFFDGSERQFGVVCDDGEDNDGDGAADFPADAQCAGPADASESILPFLPLLAPVAALVLAGVLGSLGVAAAARKSAESR